jgi:phosphoribosylanthranilate isomerase
MKFISQIYEVQTPNEASEIINLGVDHIGSVVLDCKNLKNDNFLKNTVLEVKALKRKSSVIPLFSDFEDIMQVIDYLEPDILHCCESLVFKSDYDEKKTAEKFFELQHKIKCRNKNLSIMRSIPLASESSQDLDKKNLRNKIEFFISVFLEVSDYFLTDTFFTQGNDIQPVPGFVGITGKLCDLEGAKFLVENSEIPVILAGGLSPENVFDAAVKVRPYGLDSCSNTNMVNDLGDNIRFKKDPLKVKKFVEEIRRAEKYINDTKPDFK